MKFAVLFLATLFAVALSAGPAVRAQDEVMVLEDEALAPLERPPVTFPHERHAEIIDCTRCHHDYDRYGANLGGDGQKCSTCHAADSQDGPMPLKRAFHLQCKSCHERLNSREGMQLPVMCGQCHKP